MNLADIAVVAVGLAVVWTIVTGVWLLRPAPAATSRRAVAGAAVLDSAIPPADVTEVDEAPPVLPKPLSYAERAHKAQRLNKRRPRLYWAAGYGLAAPHDGMAGGESLILEQIMDKLDDSWAIFYDLRLPGAADTIDLLLVGPGGILALELVGANRGWRHEREAWLHRDAMHSWERIAGGPVERAKGHAERVSSYLKSRGIENIAEVKAAALLLNDFSQDLSINGDDIWRAAEIGDHLAELGDEESLSTFRANRIVTVIEQELIDQAAAVTT